MVTIDRKWDRNKRRDEDELLESLVNSAALDEEARCRIVAHAATLVERIRSSTHPGLMDVFLAEYGLSTDEGVALMCLAEALLRVPDAPTIDALIEDKIAASDWSSHIGHSSSPLVNASTWGLMLTGKVLEEDEEGMAGILRAMVKRLGEPVVRTAVGGAMREMGNQFVLGQDIREAMERAAKAEAGGFTYSYDMLGEAAMTLDDAARYAGAYSQAIDAIAAACASDDIGANPGISVKLSALHPRYEVAKTERVIGELVPILARLAKKAAKAGMGLNIDAEEMGRLGLSLEIIERVLADTDLAGWAGFGVVVQAYGRRAGDVLEGLHGMAGRYNRRIMVRLVKGAYWDSEVKRAQVEGLDDFPVFSRKPATDVSYIANARTLLSMTDRIYPQFATHNAHTVAAILEMAGDIDRTAFEFQRLHGMGETLHEIVRADEGTRCRIYAPVGAHRDLLAYLVRRLLENGANSSFVNRVVDADVPARTVAACPFEALAGPAGVFEPKIKAGPDLFRPERPNSKGFDLSDTTVLDAIESARARPESLRVEPVLAGPVKGRESEPILNPATGEAVGEVILANAEDVDTAAAVAKPWDAGVAERTDILNKAADLYEEDFGRLFSLLATEAGKTLPDAVAELREAVDFMRYYAARAELLADKARGTFACISPWNFPLAIFTGQITAALAAGNAVLAKPAETTPAIAAWGVGKLHGAGVPRDALQLLPGHGTAVGAALASDARVDGIAFTGSTATAKSIQRAMAEAGAPGAPLIAETGGLNAMVVDSTALPEQAVRDVIASSFQSAGQRCSALRCLYVQKDIAGGLIGMLAGAMDELEVGDPWNLTTDIGPVITAGAAGAIMAHIDAAEADGRLMHRLAVPDTGTFVPPSLIRVGGIGDLKDEVFGPVLHVATFEAEDIDRIVADINATGYGLTFGLHTRIESRVQAMSDSVHAGNVYANRNQIGAIVGSQPFGGEGLSGTGPKAGGPHYLQRFTGTPAPLRDASSRVHVELEDLEARLGKAASAPASPNTMKLPGPTGELNQLSTLPRAPLLCLGPGVEAADEQVAAVERLGGVAVAVADDVRPDALASLPALGGVVWWGDQETARSLARSLAERPGPIIPLVTGIPDTAHALRERHLCVDTTAAGGNASLLAGTVD